MNVAMTRTCSTLPPLHALATSATSAVLPVRAPGAGDVVKGKYKLLGPLGEGGMGVVFEAEHLRLHQHVAIKFLRTDLLGISDVVERFEREAQVAVRMRGPHVARVLDVDTDAEGRPFMVMDLLRGHDLDAEIQARGRLPIHEAVDWVLQACAAVAQAHAAGIIHRDIKPANLFLADEGGARVVKVLDFGVSKVRRDDDASATAGTVTVGTPLYMSPEQARSSKDVDARTDIWSLGVTLFELIAGLPPFRGTTTAAVAAIVADVTPRVRDVRPEVPHALEQAIVTALAKAPGDRFHSVAAFAAALIPFASTGAGMSERERVLRACESAECPMARELAAMPGGSAATPATTPTTVVQAAEAMEQTIRALQDEPDARDARRDATSRAPASKSPGPRPATARAPGWRALQRHEALRTFAGALAIGVGLATAATLATPVEAASARQGTPKAMIETAAVLAIRAPVALRADALAARSSVERMNVERANAERESGVLGGPLVAKLALQAVPVAR